MLSPNSRSSELKVPASSGGQDARTAEEAAKRLIREEEAEKARGAREAAKRDKRRAKKAAAKALRREGGPAAAPDAAPDAAADAALAADEAQPPPDEGEQQARLNRLAPGGSRADAEVASEASLPVTAAVEAASEEDDDALSEEEEGEVDSTAGDGGGAVRAGPGSGGQNGGGLGSRRTSGAFSEASSTGGAALPDSWEALGEEAHEADLSGARAWPITTIFTFFCVANPKVHAALQGCMCECTGQDICVLGCTCCLC
jgi:hypothetical protein